MCSGRRPREYSFRIGPRRTAREVVDWEWSARPTLVVTRVYRLSRASPERSRRFLDYLSSKCRGVIHTMDCAAEGRCRYRGQFRDGDGRPVRFDGDRSLTGS